MGAIRGIEAARESLTFDDTVERATRATQLMSARGVQLVRSHADTTVDTGLNNVHALLDVKHRSYDIIDMQVAALIGWPLTGERGAGNRALARAAIDAGVDVIGGCPHLDDDPTGALRFLFDLASEAGVPLDLHADENTRLDSSDLEHCADLKLSTGSPVPVAASHCVALGMKPEDVQHRIADKVAEAHISVITLPLTNLYLQGRNGTSQVPRGLTPVSLLSAHGVNVAAGGDNLQDPFNPLGKADPLETAAYLVLAGHVLTDDAFCAVTSKARQAVGLPPVDISVGAPANFVLVRAHTLREALAMQSTDRIVIRRGQRLHSRI
jgi:cytosine deaminase